MKKFAALLLSLMLLSSLLCFTAMADDELQGELVICVLPKWVDETRDQGKVHLEIIKQYEELHPGVKITVQTQDATVIKESFQTAALALRENAVSIDHEQLKTADKLALFLGAEGDGLKQETIDGCDFAVMIPMYHQVNSLNVAAAGAVAFWELFGKRYE